MTTNSPRPSVNRSRVARTVFGASGLLLGLGLGLLASVSGCDDQTTTPPAANQGGANLSQNPTSLLGRSAKTAKDVASQAENRQAQASGLAGEVTGEASSLTLSGLTWAVPTSWRSVDVASGFIAREYRFDGGDGEARVTFSQFSGGAGGSIDMNVKRWVAQFKDSETGGEIDVQPASRKVADCNVMLVSLEGTMRGGMPGGPGSDTPDTALRGALIQGPEGLVVIKLTGPKETVAAADSDWNSLIQGMTRKAP